MQIVTSISRHTFLGLVFASVGVVGCADGDAQMAEKENEVSEGLFIDSQHPVSERWAILEDNGKSCWLYLTVPQEPRPERDCFVYSPVPPVEQLDVEAMKQGSPPTLTKEIATPQAMISGPSESDFELRWSSDGNSVAVIYQQTPIAMIVQGQKSGLSRALSKESPFGVPWDDEVYNATFE